MRVTGALLGLAALIGCASAIGQMNCTSFLSGASTFPIVANGTAAPIYISSEDWLGVQRAATDFAEDIERVTGVKPAFNNVTAASVSSAIPAGTQPIIVGTLGMSPLIDQIVNNTGLDVSSVENQWEAFITRVVENPLPGVSSAYVMIGADKRGSIYAMYDHSEQFGVSPWYWWADVPTTQHAELFVSQTGCYHGSPTVKYRGIFLNDEQPALENWAMHYFSNGTGAYYTGSPFNSDFYRTLFELILRIKGNYLWPAMWASAFGVDDPLNQYYADMYGVVMGTSHEEPIMRSLPVEWDLFGTGPYDYVANKQNVYDFWVAGAKRGAPYENIYTMGMRGLGDLPLGDTINIPLLEGIVSDQRQILSDYVNNNVTAIPQMWCLYQEVIGYYEDGMTVPDDVTLLWADDTWGNNERYPLYNETSRAGGAGIYYHYDLVGPPRDYKWITSSQMEKTYNQMSLAVERNATRIWILNVGDLKGYEMPIEYFINLGWDSTIWNQDNIYSFVTSWATREFGLDDDDREAVASIIHNLTRYNSRVKPELVNSTTYSLTNYREAETMLNNWETVLNESTRIYNSLSTEKQPAYFELVHHPVMASSTVNMMWIYAGMNNLLASQARVGANGYFTKVQELFQKDYDIEEMYHTILDGTIMDQPNVMYYYWQQPMQDTMPMVTWVQQRKANIAGVMRITPEESSGAWPGDNENDCAQGYSCPNPTVYLDPYLPFGSKYVDVGLGGSENFTFTVTSNVSWITVSPSGGSVSLSNPEQRVYVSVNDWSQVSGNQSALVNFTTTGPDATDTTLQNFTNTLTVPVTFVANHTQPASNFTGFVEGDGVISVGAAHTSSNTSAAGITWTELPGYGRTLSGVTPMPRTADNNTNFTAGAGPSARYDFYNFNTIGQEGNITITAYLGLILNTNGNDRPTAFALQVDDGEPQTEYYVPSASPGTQPPEWDNWVAQNTITTQTNFTAWPGAHTLTAIILLEKNHLLMQIFTDTGGLLPSYLGPPESIRV
ncbi:glycoside hydrolase family 115 protein [Coniophora puteana RWD-64-598 SS2]|uniref:Glycoside hydrolase family 115 protein n=1 Tax=Coniophora puteana (strain RWD-64-598) TaxID=741705 RepID=R7SGP1_CONPW|nr:glycoside hydrolase family 115 protein [Coniophora puteana RWD-64-598 SS2]EIW74204.1 glycoside hydrolase family 115 protein [Coniophora puteana RWD-64-598 SS2]